MADETHDPMRTDKETLLADADWFDAAAIRLERQAARYRKLAKTLRTPQETNPMNDFIERLGKAAGPDRELDALIHFAVTPELHLDAVCRKDGWIVGGNHWQPTKAPEYTRSIDAALTLVPEGRWWVLNSGVQTGTAHAKVSAGKTWETHEGDGFTPAIALYIAALRARNTETYKKCQG